MGRHAGSGYLRTSVALSGYGLEMCTPAVQLGNLPTSIVRECRCTGHGHGPFITLLSIRYLVMHEPSVTLCRAASTVCTPSKQGCT